ncbi:MAG: PEP-CTERM sorting domain-containing protein [Myxococcales bacterium]|nr:PEP-CTERM sorting domain-containing protein [Myxococcales bacterium]
MRSGFRSCLLLLLALGLSSPASALTFQLDVQEIARAVIGGEDTITYQASFTPAGGLITGYDVTIAWDANELSFGGFRDFFGGVGADPSPGLPSGARAARLDLSSPAGKAVGALFEIDFVVEPTAVLDGVLDDFQVFIAAPNGSGIGSPLGVSHDVSNPEGFGFDVASSVPEPSALALVACAGAGLALRRRS